MAQTVTPKAAYMRLLGAHWEMHGALQQAEVALRDAKGLDAQIAHATVLSLLEQRNDKLTEVIDALDYMRGEAA